MCVFASTVGRFYRRTSLHPSETAGDMQAHLITSRHGHRCNTAIYPLCTSLCLHASWSCMSVASSMHAAPAVARTATHPLWASRQSSTQRHALTDHVDLEYMHMFNS